MLQRSRSFFLSAAAVAAIGMLTAGHAVVTASTLTWDPSTTTTGSDGSGTWDNVTANWSSGSADITYLPTATTNGTATSGSNSLTVVSATNLVVGQAINGNGFASGTTITGITGTTVTLSANATASGSNSYLFTNPATAVIGKGTGAAGTVTLSGTQSAGALDFNAPLSGSYTLTGGTLELATSFNTITVAANTNTEIDSPIVAPGTFKNIVGAGSKLILAGGATISGNPQWILSGGGTVDIKSGAYNGGNIAIWTQNVNVTQEDASISLGGNRIMVGYGGNSTYTINDSGAAITQTATGNTDLIGRGGNTGTLNLDNGTVTFTSSLQIAADGASNGTLNVSGGSLTLGPSALLLVNDGATTATQRNSGTFNLSGGTVTTPGIDLGYSGVYAGTSTATVDVTAGNLYVGAGGIMRPGTGTLTTNIALSGGTVGATANWSSSMAMTLGTTNGNITFQTANAAASAENIALSGALSGVGGLNKTGGGSLTLSGANTYSGATTVAAGTLAINGTQANSNITIDSGATVNGSGTLTFNINNDTADLITDSGALDLSGLNLALNLTGTQTLRQYVLANYTGGSYSGTFASFNAPAGWSINYTGTPNEILLVNAVPEPATLGIMAMGAMGMLLIGRRRKTA